MIKFLGLRVTTKRGLHKIYASIWNEMLGLIEHRLESHKHQRKLRKKKKFANTQLWLNGWDVALNCVKLQFFTKIIGPLMTENDPNMEKAPKKKLP